MPQPRARRSVLSLAVAMAPVMAAAQGTEPKHLTLLGIPSATVAPAGLGFASISATTQRVGTAGGLDGSLAFGAGFGNADDGIGLQFTGYVTSLSDDFGDSGYLELKASRRILSGDSPTYAALTLGSLGTWGDARTRDPSVTVAVTRFSTLRFSQGGETFPVMFTLGAGTHIRNNQTDPGVFLGAGIGLTPNLGASLAWSGEYVNMGASFKFDESGRWGMTATVYDLFDQKNSQRLSVSFTYVLPSLFSGGSR